MRSHRKKWAKELVKELGVKLVDDYNYCIKTIEEVKERFPAYRGNFAAMPFFERTEKFTKEEYKDLLKEAKFHKKELTDEKLKELENIAYARAVYRFCFGWENVLEQVMIHYGMQGRGAGLKAVRVVKSMLRRRRDPFAQDRETVGKFVEQMRYRKNRVGVTDEEAMRDVEGSGDYY